MLRSRSLPAGATSRATALLVAAFAIFAQPARAIRTEFVIQETYQEFSAGEFENLSLHRDGGMLLAPGAQEIARLADAVIWGAVAGKDGVFYIGAGSEGKIFQLNEDGSIEEIFATGQVLTRAMVVDAEGRLYVGSSPNGKVYRYTGEGEPEVFFDPGEAYIWSLVFNRAGDLFVGTGDGGKIFRLPAGFEPGDEGEVYFDSDESHISALAWDGQQRLLAGTSPRGHVYRVEGREDAFVLFNSPDEEIRQVLSGQEGELYIATFASQAGQTAPKTTTVAQAIASLAGGEEKEEEEGKKTAPPIPKPAKASTTGPRPSTLYRVDRDGFHEPLWGMGGTAIHSVLAMDDGRLLIGTGGDGRLFALSGFQDWVLRQTLPSGSDLSHLLRREGSDEVYVFTSNPGRVYRLESETAGEGEYRSDIFDAEQVARWGRLYAETRGGENNDVRTYVRTGNTDRPNDHWTGWRETQEGVEARPARYLQYRLVLDQPETEVRRVRFFYRHANAAPVISALRVVTVGMGLERYVLPPQPPTLDVDQLLRSPTSRPVQTPEPRQQFRAYERPGTVTLAWQARDPNGDEMVFTLRMRGAAEDEWNTVADEVRENFYSFNGFGLPDGDYQIEVIASDHLANALGEGRIARRTSQAFTLDNTAPLIEVEQVDVSEREARVAFRVVDELSMVAAADIIVDGGDPQRLFPEDGLFDSRDERFLAVLEDLESGRHTVILRVADEARNPRIHQIQIEVPSAN